MEHGPETFSQSNATRSNVQNYQHFEPSNTPFNPTFPLNHLNSIPSQNNQDHDVRMVNEYKKFYRLKENDGFDFSVLYKFPSNLLKGIYNSIGSLKIIFY